MYLIFRIIVLLGYSHIISAGVGHYQLNVTGKATEQSSTQYGANSSRAVDGNNNSTFENGSCTHTDRNPPGSWWAVDLGKQYEVHSVGLVNRDYVANRLNQFTIYGKDLTYGPDESPDKKTCDTFSGNFGLGKTREFTCRELMNSRFVGIRLNHNEKLTLCEVYIYVACDSGKYGEDCQEVCSDNCKDQPCDRITGACPDGKCKAGYTGDMCEQACDSGKYGEGCKERCSDNCKDQPCDRVNGFCPDGKCKAGYTGDMCQQECKDGEYGEGCNNTCSEHCQDFPCEKKTGFCPNLDCKPGYIGNKCDVECPEGKYGKMCNITCSDHCKKVQCDIETGNCPGCKAGYIGDKCDMECPGGKYGNDCNSTCSEYCQELPCNIETGFCPESECKSGYRGEKCDLDCEDGQYGEGCIKICPKNCEIWPCNKTTGLCPEGLCQAGYTGENCSSVTDVDRVVDTDESGSNTGGIVGGIIVAIIVILLAAVIVLLLRKRKKMCFSEKIERQNVFSSIPGDDSNDMSRIVKKPEIAMKPNIPRTDHAEPRKETVKVSYENEAFNDNIYVNVTKEESRSKIKLGNIEKYIDEMQSLEKPFVEEYEDIPKKTSSWEEAGVAELKSKNRYVNILPYNHNRVKLEMKDDDPLSTYINASYVKDFSGQMSYIAALGPTERTVTDFWRMIWEENISHILMVTKVSEEGRMKCVQYWPNGKMSNFGEISVQVTNEENHVHYVKRTIMATKNNDSKLVTHYYYKSWPDKQTPTCITSLLEIRDLVKTWRLQGSTPILIHCSAGIGRTGTFIALDILLDQADKEGAIDVCECVTRLREQRTQMVQTLAQYVFLYEIFLEISKVGRTSIPRKNIPSMKVSGGSQDQILREYRLLEKIKPKHHSADLERGKDNLGKIRESKFIAADGPRVILDADPDVYINAVHVASYTKAKAFCATQLPLENTVLDFWKMVFQLKPAAVICLETEPTDQWKFMPTKEQPIIADQMCVSLQQKSVDAGIIVYDIAMSTNLGSVYANVSPTKDNDEEYHQLKLYEMDTYTTTALQSRNLSQILNLINMLKDHQKHSEHMPTQTVVICRNGVAETGLFIALWNLMESLDTEFEMDVFQTVKLLRKSRPEFIVSQEQYMWLYEAMSKIAQM